MNTQSSTFNTAGVNLFRVFWFTLGIIALSLGAIGIFLPILPTTPFVILAAFSFGKSAPRFQRMLAQSSLFGPIIDDWRTEGAIALRYKILALFMMITALGLSVIMAVSPVVLTIQAVCMAGAALFILTRPNGQV